ncbi:ubiquitin-like small modifier protein SAMP2 [Halorubrum kocurii]|uniref:Thiamine biosynthesis protein ThiS (Sulfur donor) n=1 Tax=Halorubrum kocurii JCM 14978 TaxID=1230456 RepID=M0NZ46_9EURY|nr:ubiquitin-like small modifier protein 2 [Halorubrum kocurii]EMA61840.1 thiamine biosynthesis protein ThiS (sulfur donor) [Halorubrum kocurii JCM 14978]
MNVSVEVVGEGTTEYDLPDDATYADLIREAGYHPQEASALVDGSPVPGDRVVDADEVRLLRLIKGGSAEGGPTNGDPAEGGPAEGGPANDA